MDNYTIEEAKRDTEECPYCGKMHLCNATNNLLLIESLQAENRELTSGRAVISLSTEVQRLEAENERLQGIVDSRLCSKHAEIGGLLGYRIGDGVTPSGGGCAVCIGMRLDAENEQSREHLRLLSNVAATREDLASLLGRPNPIDDPEYAERLAANEDAENALFDWYITHPEAMGGNTSE